MEWTSYHVPFWKRAVTLIDGSTAPDGVLLMRRRTMDGSWQYRAATPEENAEHFQTFAW